MPQVVVVDTLALAASGADENDAGELGVVLAVLGKLRERYGCAFVLLHHLGKDAGKAPMHRVRGSSALVAAADTVVHLSRDRGGLLIVDVVKQRDGALGKPLRLELQIGGEAPVLLPAGAAPPTVWKDLDEAGDALERDVVTVIAALRKLGKATRIDEIVARAGINKQRGRTAVHVALNSTPPRVKQVDGVYFVCETV